ncbi:MAG: hypothetical protein H6672_21270 [Anaerolineaceae bacterium]|nr:hypothetical protein [Anaerolineaceae bacterium]
MFCHRILLIVSLLVLVIGYTVFSAPQHVLAANITCDGGMRATVSFDVMAANQYRLNGSGPELPTRIYVASTTHTNHFTWEISGPGSWNITLEWRRPQDGIINWGKSMFDHLVVLECTGGPLAVNLLDGRINNDQSKDVAAPVAVYCQDGFVDIYLIGAVNSEGLLIIREPQVTGVPAGETQRLGSAYGVSVYWLDTGEYQLNAITFDGKLYAITWEGCDSNTLHHLSP